MSRQDGLAHSSYPLSTIWGNEDFPVSQFSRWLTLSLIWNTQSSKLKVDQLVILKSKVCYMLVQKIPRNSSGISSIWEGDSSVIKTVTDSKYL